MRLGVSVVSLVSQYKERRAGINPSQCVNPVSPFLLVKRLN